MSRRPARGLPMRIDTLAARLAVVSTVAAGALSAAPALAQAPAAPPPAAASPVTGPTIRVCDGNYEIGPPLNNPPDGSGPVIYNLVLCFAKQGNVSLIEAQTYLYYIQAQSSLPSRNDWKPFNPQSEQVIIDDHRRLWATNFLDDLSIETVD
jgi:hypothetical protein